MRDRLWRMRRMPQRSHYLDWCEKIKEKYSSKGEYGFAGATLTFLQGENESEQKKSGEERRLMLFFQNLIIYWQNFIGIKVSIGNARVLEQSTRTALEIALKTLSGEEEKRFFREVKIARELLEGKVRPEAEMRESQVFRRWQEGYTWEEISGLREIRESIDNLIYPDPVAAAYEIKDKIRDELGFTVNVGIGTNKLLAKMASDFEKPDKVHTLFPSEIPEKMWPLPVRDLLFLGKASEQKLLRAGIKTIGDMAKSDEAEMRQLLGDKNGRQLYRYANGIDDSPVRSEREEAKGYSAETTVEEDIVTYEQALSLLLAQCDVVAARMRRDGKKSSCVAVTYRTLDFKTRSHQKNFEDPTDVTEEIFAQVKKLLYECWKCEPLRLIGVALTDLTSDEFRQMSLFENTEDREKQKKVDETIDDIRRRFGNGMIVRGSTISTAGKVARKARAQLDRDVEGKQER